ncbi:uncharacterized protein LOC130745876 [Lotus japonicus]|uniref:uncharacterized protein LOC130745876 n=1 Tax=Lotus japonicus TaxID=34305 RepID=UPI002590C168|nr:uncharacterized protein LOC130745876 [Lotus japonicus]
MKMFRWLLKPKFYSKCISYVKVIKTRLDIAEKKMSARVKFMKSDIAELLRIGFDFDAYKRVEELVLEQNKLSCYELIAKFIESISDHLEDLTKQRICPDECKEAVPSLMYAAARFADLPELRDLRALFAEKFENSLEPFLSKELVEKLRRDPPARETKIGILHDIAQEFSVKWDDKTLKQRLYNTQPSLHEERPKPAKQFQRRKDRSDDSVMYRSSSDDETSTDTSSHDGQKASSSSFGSVSEDEVLEIKRPISPWLFPPPYLKQGEPSSKKTITDSEAVPKKESSKHLHEPVVKEKKTLISTRRRNHQSISDPKAYPSEVDSGQKRSGTSSHVRGKSLPNVHTNVEAVKSKDYTRATSLDSGSARHVHPNLPDYDDLVARLASVTRRS